MTNNNFTNLATQLSMARGGNENEQKSVVDLLFWSDEFEHTFSLLEHSDEQWLHREAQEQHNAKAVTLLLVGMENRYCTHDEDFIDEDTGEKANFTHAEKIEGETLFPADSAKQEVLYTQLCQNWQQTDRSELYRIWNMLKCCTTLDYSVLLHHLADEDGDSDAQTELAEAYCYGDERNGIYRNPSLAQRYYEMTGDNYDPKEDDDEDDIPCNWTYTLRGSIDTLSAVKRLIGSLCQKFGTPDNEFGLFVPLGMVMRVLVGTDAYRGNIISMEGPTPVEEKQEKTFLIIKTEADSGDFLLYALQQSFADLEVTLE